jgi:cellulose synthase/poly-beta-1,6-N-acetylglucosamine synthase-like glycosyltransferase
MSLTIGICAFNEEGTIATLIEDVLKQRGVSSSTEVIVVASGCTDLTPMIVRRIMSREPRVYLIEEEQRRGKTSAINKILANCKSELLALVDADIRLPPETLWAVLRGFSDERVGVVGAVPVIENCDENLIARSLSMISGIMTRALKELSLRAGLSFVMGETYCFRTKLIGRVPDGVVNDDAYVASYAKSMGFKVILAPEAKFVVRVPSSIPDYIAQRRRVTFGHLQIKEKMGRFATSMEGIALEYPRILLRASIEEAALRPRSIWLALVSLELEAFTRLFALFDMRLGRQHAKWRRIATTK